MSPGIGSTISENFTVTFNSGLNSNTLHGWALLANLSNPFTHVSTHFTTNAQVLNGNDFPGGISPLGAEDFISNDTVAESSLSGNTYHISVSWGPGNLVNGDLLSEQFSTYDNDNDGCVMTTPIVLRGLNTGSISASTNPAQVNTAVTTSATFSDPDTSSTHTATWDWGDGNTSAGTVSESNGSGTVSDSHTYTQAGVYTITLTVTSSSGTTATSTYQYLSVYDPTPQGLFSAGHKFTSPPGAYPQNSSLTGDVTLGLVYKYQGTVPTGNKQFVMDFKAANLTFNATTVSSLVISNGMATLTGTGTINNGSGSYNFLVTGTDGGGIRIQITDPSNNNNVVYDTQPSASITATPTTSVSGHVLVHG